MSADLAYQAVFQSVSDAILVLSDEGLAIDCNPAALTLFQCTRDEIIGTTPNDWSPEFQPDGRRSATAAAGIIGAALRGEVMHFDWTNQRRDGTPVEVGVTVSLIRSDDSSPRLAVVSRDITERLKTEDMLAKRIEALTQPLDSGSIVFQQLFRLEEIQRIQDDFAAATGVASIITHIDGTPITAPSNFTSLCSGIIRKTELGCANCYKSDAAIGRYHPDGPIVQPCLSGGLWDAGASITLGGQHIANWLIGQVRDETQTDEGMRTYARSIGVDETQFMEAFHQVPAMSRVQFEKVAQALFNLASQISSSAYQNVLQARYINERKRVEEELRESEEAFRKLFEQSSDSVLLIDDSGVFVEFNQAALTLLKMTHEQLRNTPPDRISPEFQPSGRRSDDLAPEMIALAHKKGLHRFDWTHIDAEGREFIVEVSLMPITIKGQVLLHTAWRDITERKAAADKIEHLAFYDPLTELPNRRLLVDRLAQALTSSSRHNRYGALMLLDMDDFKRLNDTLGHEVGDQFLVEVAHRLQASVREGDTVARHGGDEFVVILEDLNEDAIAPMQVEHVAVKILHAVSEPYMLNLSSHEGISRQHSYHCTSSIGITLFRGNTLSGDELMRRADTAMYQAKAAGRNSLRFFDPDMQAAVTARAALDGDLREAVLHNQFALYYQAQVDGAGRVIGAEALLRWPHPQRGMVSPVDFIPLAEASGMILPLGHWVLQTACAQLVRWAGEPQRAHLTLAVNVSARQLRMPNFVEEVLAILDHHGANPQRLKLELTESLLVDDVNAVIAKMIALKEKGVGFSLDDFGTGYSSLSYLKRLPLDQIKIDRSFIRDVLTDPNDATIARTIVALAQSMGIEVIAEGVETEAQRDFLAANGCHFYQGFLFGRPVPIEEF